MLTVGRPYTNHTLFCLSSVRQGIIYLLLISFLNTIIFPVNFYVIRYISPAILYTDSGCNTSLSEYIIEDCLHINDPTPDSGEEDVNDIAAFAQDIDVMHQMHVLSLFSELITEPKKFHMKDNNPICLFIRRSTPPPECLIIIHSV